MINRLLLFICAYVLFSCFTADTGISRVPVSYNIEYSSSDNIIIDNIEREVYKPAPECQTLDKSDPHHKKQQKYRARIWTKVLVYDLEPSVTPYIFCRIEEQKHYTKYSDGNCHDYRSHLQSRGPPALFI